MWFDLWINIYIIDICYVKIFIINEGRYIMYICNKVFIVLIVNLWSNKNERVI